MYVLYVHVALRKLEGERKKRQGLARPDELAKWEIQGVSAPKKAKCRINVSHIARMHALRACKKWDGTRAAHPKAKREKKLKKSGGAVKEK